MFGISRFISFISNTDNGKLWYYKLLPVREQIQKNAKSTAKFCVYILRGTLLLKEKVKSGKIFQINALS